MKKLLIVCMVIPLLSGCWDEVLYKDITIVPLIGIEGENDELTMYFSFPTFNEDTVEYHMTTGKGFSIRSARNDAFLHSNEMLDISQVELFLISEETAKQDMYNYIDPLYRTPRNRLNGHMILTRGDMDAYFEENQELPAAPSEYYKGLLETSIKFSKVPDVDFQSAIRTYFEKGQDLVLPIIEMSDELNLPEIKGVGLFSKRHYTGEHLDADHSKFLVLASEAANNKYLQFEYEWEEGGKKYPLVVEYVSKKEERKIQGRRIQHQIELKVSVEEFPHDHLSDQKIINELNAFLSDKITADFQNMIHILQEAKSDAVGYGKTVRAFHPDLWARGEWQETFSTMEIDVNVKVKIVRTGLLG